MPKQKDSTPKKEKKTKEKKTTKGVAKKKKDPNQPKGVRGAYIIFSQEMREKILEEKKNLKVTEVSKELGKRWKALTDDEKKPYVEKAEKDKKRYEEEMAKWKSQKKAESEDD